MFKLQTTNFITIFYISAFLSRQPIQGELHFFQELTPANNKYMSAIAWLDFYHGDIQYIYSE